MAVTEAKQQVWEQFGEAMEKDFQSAPSVWKTIRPYKREKQGTIQVVHSKDEKLLTLTEEIIKWWRQHFEEPLNPTNPPSTIEAELEDDINFPGGGH